MNHALFDEPKRKNAGPLMTALGVMALSVLVLIVELNVLPREHAHDYSPHKHAHHNSLALNSLAQITVATR